MKKHIISLFALTTVFLAVATTSCTDEILPGTVTPTGAFTPKGQIVDAYLSLNVAELSIKATTRAASDDSEAERRIKDIWVFQYDHKTGYLINDPHYYTITNQENLADLTDIVENGYVIKASDNNGAPSIVYVVANTHDKDWVKNENGEYTGFNSLGDLKKHTIPDPAPIRITSSDDTDEGDISNEESLAIPMGGSCGDDGRLVVSAGYRITVDVERMFAKLYVTINLKNSKDVQDSKMEQLMIEHIARSCTVAYCEVDGSWYYPTTSVGSNFEVSRTFVPGESTTEKKEDGTKTYGPFILYVPENYQKEGTIENAINLTPSLNYEIKIENSETAKITPSPSYTAYPGSWNANNLVENHDRNYEIRRNNIYDITLSITANDDITPSANCLIAKAGTTIAFYPYVRDEVPTDDMIREDGNRYDFETYLNSSYEGEGVNDNLKIKGVKIVWQTKSCIGDNLKGDLVWIDPAPVDDNSNNDDETTKLAKKSANEYRRKIYVKVKNSGNALIAAYDDEKCEGNILWSWHIWVPNEGVDPEGGAIEYYHYLWNSTTGIDTDTYVPGRLVMNLNLGALREVPQNAGEYDDDTYGTLYQWGRKDPFPPVKSHAQNYVALSNVIKGGSPQFYNYADGTNTSNSKGTFNVIIGVYDNANQQIDLSGYDGSINGKNRAKYKFSTNSSVKAIGGDLGTTNDGVIKASIKDPTMFIAAAGHLDNNSTNEGQANHIGSYYYEGDWLPDADDFLWGGGHPSTGEEYKVYSYNDGDGVDAYLEDDYGPNKTIFDPCPYGWRVAPGDLWLGFTNNGKNWVHNGNAMEYWNDLNCADVGIGNYTSMEVVNSQNGYTMYMQGWRSGKTSFFPVQPARVPSGQPYLNGGICGNYHNATVDRLMEYQDTDKYIRRVDILHFHAESAVYGMVKPFTNELYYYTKAVAGPLRCVRDTKR